MKVKALKYVIGRTEVYDFDRRLDKTVTMNDSTSGKLPTTNFEQLSRRTGLIVRSVDAASLATLFDRLLAYDANERAETFTYLRQALDETRAQLHAEPIFKTGF